jgi:hypothetical protein
MPSAMCAKGDISGLCSTLSTRCASIAATIRSSTGLVLIHPLAMPCFSLAIVSSASFDAARIRLM